MGKWEKYNKSFNKSWLSDPVLGKWILEVPNDSTRAYCKVCRVTLRAQKADLKKHADSSKHKQNSASIISQPKLKDVLPVAKTLTKFEIKLAVFVACHTAIKSVDHLTELININSPTAGSSSENFNLQLHRTKCTAIINNVIAVNILKQQVEDMKDMPFSIIIDESTDVACIKHLCICCRYFNNRKNKIVTQFLGLVQVTSTTAEDLYQHLVDFFKNVDIDLSKCFAIATDGASNLCGVNNSLYTRMKNVNPRVILVKCICHSLHLVCCHAFEEIPSNIDYMLRETHNWFHRSALRRESYMNIYKLINDGKPPLQLIPLSGTRWLARSNCVKRILDQYEALKLHFELASSHCDKYISRELCNMYSDGVNELYLTFLKPILADFERINLVFQKEEADHARILIELQDFTLSLLRRILFTQYVKLDVNLDFVSIYLPIEKVDFGYEFTSLLQAKVKCSMISECSNYSSEMSQLS